MPNVKIRLVKSTLVEEELWLPVERAGVRTPVQAAALFSSLSDSPVERFAVAYLDARHAVIGLDLEVSKGTATTSLVHPREILGPALRLGACALIVAHNHPSGDPEPSAEDYNVTERLVAAGDLVGVSVLDHIVIGDLAREGAKYFSIRGRGNVAVSLAKASRT